MSFLRYLPSPKRLCRLRITRLISRPFRSFWRRYKSPITSFCCNKLSLATLGIVTFISLVVLVYFLFQLRNEFLVDLKFKTGWWETAVVSIAILDTAKQINFPSHSPDTDADKAIQSYLQEENASSIIWKVDGFTNYAEEFADIQTLGPFNNTLRDSKTLNQAGFWVFSYGPSAKRNGDGDLDKKRLSPTSAIRAFKITEHLEKASNIPPENLEVAVALKAYVEGEAAVVIRYEDSLTKKFHLDEIPKTRFKKEGFCFIILDVPFDKRIDMANKHEPKEGWISHHRPSCYCSFEKKHYGKYDAYFGAHELVLEEKQPHRQ